MTFDVERAERVAMGIVGWIPMVVVLLFGIHAVHALVDSVPRYYELRERKRQASEEARRLEERVHLLRRRTNALTKDPWTIERHLRMLFGKTETVQNTRHERYPSP